MKHLVLKGHEILALGFPQGKAIGVAIRVVSDRFTIEQREYAINLLRAILKRPHRFADHEVYGDIVLSLNKSTTMKKQKVGQQAPVLEPVRLGSPMQV
jgi:tRNA-splicing ligase RtcB